VTGVLRRVAPLAFAFAAYLAAVGGLLASRYEAGNAAPFLALGAAVIPIVLLARAWAAVGSLRVPARIGRALLSATTVFAAALAVLEAINPAYLDGFGL
jgi:hypothetical protein